MKKIFSLLLIASTLLFAACGNAPTKEAATNTDSTENMAADTSATVSFDASQVDNKKDPTCGMPTSAGISDTAHYKNKVIGFCAKECKEEFLKNPEANLAAAELK